MGICYIRNITHWDEVWRFAYKMVISYPVRLKKPLVQSRTSHHPLDNGMMLYPQASSTGIFHCKRPMFGDPFIYGNPQKASYCRMMDHWVYPNLPLFFLGGRSWMTRSNAKPGTAKRRTKHFVCIVTMVLMVRKKHPMAWMIIKYTSTWL